ATAFLLVGLLFAAWIGGRNGRVAGLLFPLAFAALPVLYSLQYGQFHLTTLVLAIAAMLVFERNRNVIGGLLLGFAILSKLWPGVLMIWLAVRRQWWAHGYTTAACAVYTIAGYFVVGYEPFEAFIDYQLPRLADGRAFAFEEAWPELGPLVIADNQSLFGVVQKLGALGVPGMTKSLGATIQKLFGLFVVLVALSGGMGGPIANARVTGFEVADPRPGGWRLSHAPTYIALGINPVRFAREVGAIHYSRWRAEGLTIARHFGPQLADIMAKVMIGR
ncbi:MAG: DUF2029 domain-containing protein, partial [bacterium]|nr:DUF2029 domain-containing protein [bacterium]